VIKPIYINVNISKKKKLINKNKEKYYNI